jgi:hypothetical protein
MIHQIKALRASFEIKNNKGEFLTISSHGKEYHGNWLYIAYPYEAWGCLLPPDLFLFPCELTDDEASSLARAALQRALLALEKEAQETAEFMTESDDYGADVEWMSSEMSATGDDPCHIIFYHQFVSNQDHDPAHDEQAYIVVKCSPRAAEWIEGI